MSARPAHSVAAHVRRVLRRYNVGTVFALAGASQSALLDELDRAGVRIISSRHESATVGAADGYARVTGKIGVAFINVDHGMANAVTGILSAFEARSPVLVLVGREPDGYTEPEMKIDHDELAMVRGVSKWARTVHAASRVPEYVDMACRRALTGPCGPVVIAYPEDFLDAACDPGVDFESPAPRPPRVLPHDADIEHAADLLARAKRPVIIAGSEAARARAAEALRALSRDWQIPVFTNAMGRGLVPEDATLGFPWPVAQTAAKDADLVLWTGARMARRLAYGLSPRFDAQAAFIQIDPDPLEIGRNRDAQVGIAADVRETLERLGAALANRRNAPFDPAWVAAALQDRLAGFAAQAAIESEPVNPFRIGHVIGEEMPKDAIFVQDGAVILSRTFGVLRLTEPYSYIDTYPLGSMGMGTPMAVGAAAAAKEMAEATGTRPRPVILLTGDGAFGFYPMELSGAVQAGLDLTVFISNNHCWGNELFGQMRDIGRNVNTFFPPSATTRSRRAWASGPAASAMRRTCPARCGRR
jgi:acetolactate synthase-1/2/3 large subunit